MTPQEAKLLAQARLRLKNQRVNEVGNRLQEIPGERIEGAFQDAANQPKTSIVRPERKYGFTDRLKSSLPFGDEVAALGGAVGRYAAGKTGLAPERTFRESYDQARAIERAAQEEYDAESPGASIGAQLLGVTAIGPGKVAPTLLGKVGQGIVGGGAVGTAYGAGEGEGLEERAKGGVIGGAFGAGVGAAVPPVLAGAGGLIKRAMSPATGAAANRFTPGNRATSIVEESLRRDNVPVSAAMRRLSTAGPDMVLADVAGANTRGLARAAVNTPGAARERITDFVMERNLRTPERITNAVTAVLRNPDDFGRTVARMGAERENIAQPIYQKAFREKPAVNVAPVVKHIDDVIKPGVNQVVDPLADLRPDGMTATLAKLRSYFQTSKNQRFDLEALHRVKMEIDDLIGRAKRAGDNNMARAVLGVQTRLLKAMDQASPDYKRARQIYSTTHGMEEALDVGRNIFKMRADDVTSELAGMTAGEREMVQVGLARAIQDQVESRGFGSDVIKTVFKNPQIMKAIRAAFQNDGAFNRFRATLVREAQMRRTSEAVTGNSTTARQIADMMDTQSGSVGRDVFNQLLEGHPVRAVATAVRQAIFGEKGINEKVANRIADMLLSNDPQMIQSALRALERREGAVQRLAQRMSAAQRLTTTEGASGGATALTASPRPAAQSR